MALTHGDIAECKIIGQTIAKEMLREHVTSCPHAFRMAKQRMFMIGTILGVGLASGIAGGGVAVTCCVTDSRELVFHRDADFI